MLPIKTIKRIRFLYFDEGYSANDIAKKYRCTPNTVFSYIKMDDFNPKPKIKHTVKSKITPYIPLITTFVTQLLTITSRSFAKKYFFINKIIYKLGGWGRKTLYLPPKLKDPYNPSVGEHKTHDKKGMKPQSL